MSVQASSRLIGRRLYLRGLSPVDCTETYVEWLNDPEVNRYLETRFSGTQSLETIRRFVEETNRRANEHLFGIFQRADDLHIGNIKLGPVLTAHGLGDVSLFIGMRAAWARGYASESIQLITDFGFRSLGMRKLCSSMYAPNEGSRRAFLRSGYREEARRPDHYLLDDRPCDLVLMGLQRSDYLQQGFPDSQ